MALFPDKFDVLKLGNLQLLFFAVKFFLVNFDFSAPKVPRCRFAPVLLGIRRQRKIKIISKLFAE